MTLPEVNLKHGELRISGRRTKNGKQKVLYLSGEPLEVLKAQEKVTRHCDRVFVDALGDPLRYDAILEVSPTGVQTCKDSGRLHRCGKPNAAAGLP